MTISKACLRTLGTIDNAYVCMVLEFHYKHPTFRLRTYLNYFDLL